VGGMTSLRGLGIFNGFLVKILDEIEEI